MSRQNEILAIRREKDQFFKLNPQSPLSPDQQDRFDGLRYYDFNPDLNLIVEAERIDEGKPFVMETTTGELRRYKRYARFTFTVDGTACALTIYETPFGYFLPFTDANAGSETYDAGRYLEPEQLGDDRFHVDFNLAYNPFCAYAAGYSCPLTPAENRLKVAIRAGEQTPEGDWVNA
jgi:hypothetical protein